MCIDFDCLIDDLFEFLNLMVDLMVDI